MTVSPEEFTREQEHLSDTYATLQRIERTARERLNARLVDAAVDRDAMLEELAVDYDNGTNLETYAEIEAMHKIIDAYNLANDQDTERIVKAQALLQRPYFAKISLRFKPNEEPRDLYLGATGIANENRKQIIIDWRSPVAEVYYNQSSGHTSYRADDRIIEAELVTRRQFDIVRNTLRACFDTTVAIQDPLLLQSLARERSDKLADITATIQKEQNVVVRHEDVPVLLVNGIAGSGKTSVLLQRIAYLFYRERDTLNPTDVFLITPNPVFRAYIDDVLPSMGERNPHIVTWKGLAEQLGLSGRASSNAESALALRRIDSLLESLALEDRDFQDICVGDERVITAGQARAAYRRFSRIPQGPHRSALVCEELLEKLESRITRLARTPETQDEIYDLSEEDMRRIFGQTLVIQEEEELPGLARRMLEDRYANVAELIESGAWLRIDRIGMRMLGANTLSAEEWLYVKLALAGGANRSARYVMIDEVQDYTEAQLMMLARYFCNAHFLLLGDPNQAIRPNTATFEQIKQIFTEARGSVCECFLMTSYRSTPHITALFTALMHQNNQIKTSSVQREGAAPRIIECDSHEQYRAEFERVVRDAIARCAEVAQATDAHVISNAEGSADAGDANISKPDKSDCALDRDDTSSLDGAPEKRLIAILPANNASLRSIRKLLGSFDAVEFTELTGKNLLPKSGLVLADVTSAKGLEFDEVIVPDAQASIYADDDLWRHRLYTAISRATQCVTVLADGELTSLLRDIDAC